MAAAAGAPGSAEGGGEAEADSEPIHAAERPAEAARGAGCVTGQLGSQEEALRQPEEGSAGPGMDMEPPHIHTGGCGMAGSPHCPAPEEAMQPLGPPSPGHGAPAACMAGTETPSPNPGGSADTGAPNMEDSAPPPRSLPPQPMMEGGLCNNGLPGIKEPTCMEVCEALSPNLRGSADTGAPPPTPNMEDSAPPPRSLPPQPGTKEPSCMEVCEARAETSSPNLGGSADTGAPNMEDSAPPTRSLPPQPMMEGVPGHGAPAACMEMCEAGTETSSSNLEGSADIEMHLQIPDMDDSAPPTRSLLPQPLMEDVPCNNGLPGAKEAVCMGVTSVGSTGEEAMEWSSHPTHELADLRLPHSPSPEEPGSSPSQLHPDLVESSPSEPSPEEPSSSPSQHNLDLAELRPWQPSPEEPSSSPLHPYLDLADPRPWQSSPEEPRSPPSQPNLALADPRPWKPSTEEPGSSSSQLHPDLTELRPSQPSPEELGSSPSQLHPDLTELRPSQPSPEELGSSPSQPNLDLTEVSPLQPSPEEPGSSPSQPNLNLTELRPPQSPSPEEWRTSPSQPDPDLVEPRPSQPSPYPEEPRLSQLQPNPELTGHGPSPVELVPTIDELEFCSLPAAPAPEETRPSQSGLEEPGLSSLKVDIELDAPLADNFTPFQPNFDLEVQAPSLASLEELEPTHPNREETALPPLRPNPHQEVMPLSEPSPDQSTMPPSKPVPEQETQPIPDHEELSLSKSIPNLVMMPSKPIPDHEEFPLSKSIPEVRSLSNPIPDQEELPKPIQDLEELPLSKPRPYLEDLPLSKTTPKELLFSNSISDLEELPLSEPSPSLEALPLLMPSSSPDGLVLSEPSLSVETLPLLAPSSSLALSEPSSSLEVLSPIEPTSTLEVMSPSEPSSSLEVLSPSEPSFSLEALSPSEPGASLEVLSPSEPSASLEVLSPSEPSASMEVLPTPEPSSIMEVLPTSEPSSILDVLPPSEPSSSLEVLSQSKSNPNLEKLSQSKAFTNLHEQPPSEPSPDLEVLTPSEPSPDLEVLTPSEPSPDLEVLTPSEPRSDVDELSNPNLEEQEVTPSLALDGPTPAPLQFISNFEGFTSTLLETTPSSSQSDPDDPVSQPLPKSKPCHSEPVAEKFQEVLTEDYLDQLSGNLIQQPKSGIQNLEVVGGSAVKESCLEVVSDLEEEMDTQGPISEHPEAALVPLLVPDVEMELEEQDLCTPQQPPSLVVASERDLKEASLGCSSPGFILVNSVPEETSNEVMVKEDSALKSRNESLDRIDSKLALVPEPLKVQELDTVTVEEKVLGHPETGQCAKLGVEVKLFLNQFEEGPDNGTQVSPNPGLKPEDPSGELFSKVVLEAGNIQMPNEGTPSETVINSEERSLDHRLNLKCVHLEPRIENNPECKGKLKSHDADVSYDPFYRDLTNERTSVQGDVDSDARLSQQRVPMFSPDAKDCHELRLGEPNPSSVDSGVETCSDNPDPCKGLLVPERGGDPGGISHLVLGSEVQVKLDHIIQDALVVSFRHGERIFSGVLMDLSKRFGPHGIPVTLHPQREYKSKPEEPIQVQSTSFQEEVKNETTDENGTVPADVPPVQSNEPCGVHNLWTSKPPPLFHEGAPYPPPLFIRDTYNQSIPQPPPRKIKRLKKRIYREEPTSIMNAIKLRPRQVLCDKCKNVVADKREVRKTGSDSLKLEEGKRRRLDSVTTVNKKLKTEHKVNGKSQSESQKRNSVSKVPPIAPSRGKVVKVASQTSTQKAQLHTKKVLQSKNMDHAKAREVLKMAKEKAHKKQKEASSSKSAHNKVHFTRRLQTTSSGTLPPRLRIKPQRYRNEENDSSLKIGLESLRSSKVVVKPQTRHTSATRSAGEAPSEITSPSNGPQEVKSETPNPSVCVPPGEQQEEPQTLSKRGSKSNITVYMTLNQKKADSSSASVCSSDSIDDLKSTHSECSSTENFDFPPGSMHAPSSSSSSSSKEEKKLSNSLKVKMFSKNVSKCLTADGRTICVGDIVWAKIYGFPWWPARILTITVSRKDNGLLVRQEARISWFGSPTTSHLAVSQLSPFLENFQSRFNKKRKGLYRKAITEAAKAAKQLTPEVRALLTQFET